jgi:hypothetical protein
MSIFFHGGKWHDHPAKTDESIPEDAYRRIGYKMDPHPPTEDMCKKCFPFLFENNRHKRLDNNDN